MMIPSAPLIGIGSVSCEGWRRSEIALVQEKVAPESSCHGKSVETSEAERVRAVAVREKLFDIMYLLRRLVSYTGRVDRTGSVTL